jgi:hypothetical protein
MAVEDPKRNKKLPVLMNIDVDETIDEVFGVKTQQDEEKLEIFLIAYKQMSLKEIEARLGNKFQVGTSEMPKICGCSTSDL